MPRNEENTRFKPYGIDRLHELRDVLSNAVHDLTVAIDTLEKRERKSVFVDGTALIDGRSEFVSNFSAGCKKSALMPKLTPKKK